VHDLQQEQRAETALQKPVQEQAEEQPKGLELASAIGNQGVQRVAGSPALQRSPAAAGLLGHGQIARQKVEEETDNKAEEAGGNENAAEAAPAGTENAAGGAQNANAEAGGNENAEEEKE
jgi:hypothetical protein